MSTTIYDDTRQLIDDTIGDVLCIKGVQPNGWWILRPDGVPNGKVALRVLAGWNGEVLVAPHRVGREPAWSECVSIGRGVPEHIARNVLGRTIREFLAAIRHGEFE